MKRLRIILLGCIFGCLLALPALSQQQDYCTTCEQEAQRVALECYKGTGSAEVAQRCAFNYCFSHCSPCQFCADLCQIQ